MNPTKRVVVLASLEELGKSGQNLTTEVMCNIIKNVAECYYFENAESEHELKSDRQIYEQLVQLAKDIKEANH